MARSKVARAQSRSKTEGKAAKAQPEAAAPQLSTLEKIQLAPYLLTGAAFDGQEDLRDDCSAADLFRLSFDAPNAHDGMLEQLLACVCDDLELINAAALSEHSLDEVIARVANRNRLRIKVGVLVARRVEAARAALEVRP